MAPESRRAPDLELVPADPEHEPILANLLELYSHDFSEFIDLELQPDGRFGYPRLPLYWQERNRHPFLVRLDGQLAGLVFVTRASRLNGDPSVYDMTEFFIARGHRKRGVGTRVAKLVWERFPGAWEVRVIESNDPARSFWRSATGDFAPSAVQEEVVTLDGKQWYVFSFVSSGTTSSPTPGSGGGGQG